MGIGLKNSAVQKELEVRAEVGKCVTTWNFLGFLMGSWAVGRWKMMTFGFPVGLNLKTRATLVGLVLTKLDLNG